MTVIEEPEPKPNMQKPPLKNLGPPNVATTTGVVGAGAVAPTDDEGNDAESDDGQ